MPLWLTFAEERKIAHDVYALPTLGCVRGVDKGIGTCAPNNVLHTLQVDRGIKREHRYTYRKPLVIAAQNGRYTGAGTWAAS
jgi:hypothetical protein